MNSCTIPGCLRKHEARGMCEMHYSRWKRHGAPVLVTAERGKSMNRSGYRVFSGKLEHVAVAERAFGGILPKGAVVHHIDYNKSNNDPSNLLVCSRAYHKMIHQRTDAYLACGNASWVKCGICKKYDDPGNLYIQGTSRYYKKCRAEKSAKPVEQWTRNGNISGLIGARWNKRTSKWFSVVKVNGQEKQIGTFATAQEAHLAYVATKLALKQGCDVPGARLVKRDRLTIR